MNNNKSYFPLQILQHIPKYFENYKNSRLIHSGSAKNEGIAARVPLNADSNVHKLIPSRLSHGIYYYYEHFSIFAYVVLISPSFLTCSVLILSLLFVIVTRS